MMVVLVVVIIAAPATVAAVITVITIIIRTSTMATPGLSCTTGGTLPPTPEWFETVRYSNEELCIC